MSFRCEQLTAGYARHTILHELSVTVQPGRLTVLLGANGCGKSTLLKVLAGQLPVQQGRVSLLERAITDWSANERARVLAYLPQHPTVHADLTVFDLVRLGRFPHQSWRHQWQEQDADAVQQALAVTGLLALADVPVATLSGGQQQRAWIAMTLAQQGDILLLDEPVNHLDLNHQIQMMDLLRQLANQGKTLIVVLHDLNLASRYADELILLVDGRVVAQGDASRVLQPEIIARALGQQVRVIPDPVYGSPLVIPLSEVLSPTR
jgi:iron complex transport system ATP-binding protein